MSRISLCRFVAGALTAAAACAAVPAAHAESITMGDGGGSSQDVSLTMSQDVCMGLPGWYLGSESNPVNAIRDGSAGPLQIHVALPDFTSLYPDNNGTFVDPMFALKEYVTLDNGAWDGQHFRIDTPHFEQNGNDIGKWYFGTVAARVKTPGDSDFHDVGNLDSTSDHKFYEGLTTAFDQIPKGSVLELAVEICWSGTPASGVNVFAPGLQVSTYAAGPAVNAGGGGGGVSVAPTPASMWGGLLLLGLLGAGGLGRRWVRA